MARVFRSLRDLRDLIPQPASKTSPASRDVTASESRGGSPVIPCSSCGRPILYSAAVPRRIADGWLGFAHPTCKVKRVVVKGDPGRRSLKSFEEARERLAAAS